MSLCIASCSLVAAPVAAGPSRRASPATAARAPQRLAAHRHKSQTLSSPNGARRRALTIVSAEEGSGAPKPPAPETPAAAPDAEASKGGLKEGQLTAIITGGFSLILGIGYLALVNAIGNRELLPPPPEALGM